MYISNTNKQNYAFGWLEMLVESLDTEDLFHQVKYPKFLCQQMRDCVNKTLDSAVIHNLMSPLSLSINCLCHNNQGYFKLAQQIKINHPYHLIREIDR